jgi:hypothetical protein
MGNRRLTAMWRFAKAQVTGSSHVKTGLPCQDRLRCVVLATDTLIAAVADGAGSATLADCGAEIAVEIALRSLSLSLESGISDLGSVLREAAVDARNAVIAEAKIRGLEPRELASTLLIIVAGSSDGGALQIGDGVIVVRDAFDDLCWVFWPQRGEYANTTRFLTDEDAADWVQIEALPGAITGVALMTDGLEPLALHYATKSVHEPFFRTMFQPLAEADGSGEIEHLSGALEDFLTSDRVSARTDDDLSLILAIRQ